MTHESPNIDYRQLILDLFDFIAQTERFVVNILNDKQRFLANVQTTEQLVNLTLICPQQKEAILGMILYDVDTFQQIVTDVRDLRTLEAIFPEHNRVFGKTSVDESINTIRNNYLALVPYNSGANAIVTHNNPNLPTIAFIVSLVVTYFSMVMYSNLSAISIVHGYNLGEDTSSRTNTPGLMNINPFFALLNAASTLPYAFFTSNLARNIFETETEVLQNAAYMSAIEINRLLDRELHGHIIEGFSAGQVETHDGLVMSNQQRALNESFIFNQNFLFNQRCAITMPSSCANAEALDKLDNQEIQIPEEYVCPLSRQVMTDPVYDPSYPKQSFERSWLENHLSRDHRNPLNRQPLTKDKIVSNTILAEKIRKFIKNTIDKEAITKQARQIGRNPFCLLSAERHDNYLSYFHSSQAEYNTATNSSITWSLGNCFI